MYNAQIRSQESHQSNARGILMVLLAVVAGAAIALWLVAWSTGWKPLGVTAWSVESGSSVGTAQTEAAAMPRPRQGLVETADNRGQVLYGRYCDSCHTAGKAGIGPSLRTANFKSTRTAADITAYVRKGGFTMPAFNSGLVTDADLALLVQFIVAMPVDGPAGASAPAAQAQGSAAAPVDPVGAGLYAKSCGACHPDGNAGMGPGLRGANMKAKSVDELSQFVRAGGPKMPGFKADTLSDADLNAIVKYMLALQ